MAWGKYYVYSILLAMQQEGVKGGGGWIDGAVDIMEICSLSLASCTAEAVDKMEICSLSLASCTAEAVT